MLKTLTAADAARQNVNRNINVETNLAKKSLLPEEKKKFFWAEVLDICIVVLNLSTKQAFSKV